jgi:hypothetical protein
MGNIFGRGTDINENAIEPVKNIADEISGQLMAFGAPGPDFVLSAFGNGTNTLALAQRFRVLEPEARVCAYEMVLSGVGYAKKYGEDKYRQLLDRASRYCAKDFARHSMPGTSYPGIDFPAARKAISLVDRVVLTADSIAEREYEKVTGNALPEDVVRTRFGITGSYGRSTEAGISVARRLAEKEDGKTFVVIGYDTRDRYDYPMVETTRRQRIGILGGHGKFGAALEQRLAQTARTQIKATVDKAHNRQVVRDSDVVVVTVRRENVDSLLREISPALRSGTQIVSFVAGYPLALISAVTGMPAARGMADPWWNVSAAMPGPGFSEANLRLVFDGLTKNKVMSIETDKAMDDFTVAISYAFVVLLRKRSGAIINPDEHLKYIASRIGVSSAEDMSGFLPQADPNELIALAATKGGISEAILRAIQAEPNIGPASLFERLCARPQRSS